MSAQENGNMKIDVLSLRKYATHLFTMQYLTVISVKIGFIFNKTSS